MTEETGGLEAFFEEPVRIPITDEIDLHTFSPRDCRHVLEAYFDECRRLGITQVRVIHGKGSGRLKETVREFLRESPWVLGVYPCDEGSGSWGATRVRLRMEA